LKYHVVAANALSNELRNGQVITTLSGDDIVVTIDQEGKVFINNAEVIFADLKAGNGVVHVIDVVLIPAETPATVFDIIEGSEVHTTLAAAIEAAGLEDALRGEGPFTVFAPTDAAFDALPAGLVDALLADPSGDLTSILLYHVVADNIPAANLQNGQTLATLFGEALSVSIDQQVLINNAHVVITDLVAGNGIVHVIDAVLVPTTLSTDNRSVAEINLLLYPNPSRDFISLQGEVNAPTKVVAEIFNITGARVMTKDLGYRSSLFTESIRINDLPQGIYMMNIRFDNQVVSRKFTVIK
jgi:uncharacterized surface protein with fasciclin (FAS1) repeats